MGWSLAHHRGTPARDELNAPGKRQAQPARRPARALSTNRQVLSYVQHGMGRRGEHNQEGRC